MADACPKRGRHDALIDEIRRTASLAQWTVTIENETVWFADGVARIKVSLEDLAADFAETLLRVSARLRDAKSVTIRQVPHRSESFSAAPWHEFDQGGRHISEKG